MWQRLVDLLRGFLGIFLSGLERGTPEALLEVEKQNLRKQIIRYNQGLISHAALCESMISRLRALEAEERSLTAKIPATLKTHREAAGRYALRLKAVGEEIAETRRNLEQAEATYKDMLKARDTAVAGARAKLDVLKSSLNDLKMKRAIAELTEISTGMVNGMGDTGDTLDRLQSIVEEERHKAAGRVRVARDSMDANGVRISEAEQSAAAAQALEEFEIAHAVSDAVAKGGAS